MSDEKNKPLITNIIPNGVSKHDDDTKLWVNFSVIYNVNLNSSLLVGEENERKKFLKSIDKLKEHLIKINDKPIEIDIIVENQKHTHTAEVELLENYTRDEIYDFRKDLWDELFGNNLLSRTNKTRPIEKDTINTISSFLPRELNLSDKLKNVVVSNSNKSTKKQLEDIKLNLKDPLDALNKKLDKVVKFAEYNNLLKKNEKKQFVNELLKELQEKGELKLSKDTEVANFLINYSQNVSDAYLRRSKNGKESHLDEIVYCLNAIQENNHLARLFGMVLDYKVSIDKNIGDFQIKLGDQAFKPLNAYIIKTISSCKIISNKKQNKFACILDSKSTYGNYFYNSILRTEDSKLESFNDIAQAYGLKNGDNPEHQQTVGLSYKHNKLRELINPLNKLPDKNTFYDEYLTEGYRVAALLDDDDYNNFRSLTLRKTEVIIKKDNVSNVIKKSHAYHEEIGIKFDSAVQYLDDDDGAPEIKTEISDEIFNYNGELFSLNSAFSKAEENNSEEDQDDIYLAYAENRINKFLNYSIFPKSKKTDRLINFHYTIPDYKGLKLKSPKLRFFKNYNFVIYQEYANGWALPLNSDNKNDIQLSISDIIKDVDASNSESSSNIKLLIGKEYCPLEDKRQVNLFNRYESKPSDKGANDNFVVRSSHYTDDDQFTTHKHCLGPRIEFETAWYYNELENIKKRTFELKRRANCEFKDSKDYDKNKKNGSVCCEGCTNYCGGTQMKSFDNSKHIFANYLTDPTVEGFKAKLSYDKEGDKDSNLPLETQPIKFKLNNKSKVINQKSILIKASGGKRKTFFEISNDVLDINIKKGGELFLHLTNVLNEKGEEALAKGWWYDKLSEGKKKEEINYFTEATQKERIENLSSINELVERRNLPKILKVVHAVKKPLVNPEIKRFYSKPQNGERYGHISNLLVKEYQKYKLLDNIFSERVANTDGTFINSTKFKLIFESLFERLDAFVDTNANRINFINEILPTGSLEIWMRTERYADDADEFIFPKPKDNNRITPDSPILSFTDEQNIFTLEHRLEFSDEILSQLKQPQARTGTLQIVDEFIEVISKLEIILDVKSSRFEEREYYLKNTSKFIGYFDEPKKKFIPKVSEVNENNELEMKEEVDLEDFSLPETSDVMKSLLENSPFRFKTLLLNNSKPNKPIVKYAITTIQEHSGNVVKNSIKKSRNFDSSQLGNINKSQQGNIVTVYFERGRLSSGKNERVALVIDGGERSIYNDEFKRMDLISKVGRDAVTDRFMPSNEFLEMGDIIIPDNNSYQAERHDDLGIVHYLPKFDLEKQLWKIEIEFNVRTKNYNLLHNPFIHLALLHYQPFSLNYAKDKTDYEKDCRVSDIEKSTWCHLLPERSLSISFDSPGLLDNDGSVKLTLVFDYESLNHDLRYGKIRSNFIMTIEGSDDNILWYPVRSRFTGKSYRKDEKMPYHHALIDKYLFSKKIDYVEKEYFFDVKDTESPFDYEKWKKFDSYRVRIVEVEWFTKEAPIDFNKIDEDVLNNEKLKIRYVQLIN